jgi:nucleotide-binding universal stress UspA family protein
MKVLIPVDESRAALRAIDWVAQVQQDGGVPEVTLMNVRTLPETYGGLSVLYYETLERVLREAQQRVLATALDHAQRAGLRKVSIHAAHGLPAEQIVEVAKEIGADQIVMGTRAQRRGHVLSGLCRAGCRAPRTDGGHPGEVVAAARCCRDSARTRRAASSY